MKIAVAFYYENHLYYGLIDENSRITIGSSKFDNIQVPGLQENQFLLKKRQNVYLTGYAPYNITDYPLEIGKSIKLNQKHGMILYLSNVVATEAVNVRLPQDGKVTLGRSEENHISVGLKYISRRHLGFVCRDGLVKVVDVGSSNGTYVNGKLIKETMLQDGDVISVHTFRVTYMNHVLYFENCGGTVKVGKIPGTEQKEVKKEMKTGILFKRSPRIQSQLPTEPIVLASPPNKGPEFQKSRGMFLSLLSTGTMFATSMLMGAASPVFMAARAASLIMPLANMGYQKNNDKKRKEQLEQYERLRKELYGQYIADQKRRIEMTADEQRRILQEENPSIEKCMSMVRYRERNLWERTGRDRDFLDVRMGMGYDELCVPIKANISEHAFQMEQDEMRQLAAEIMEETKYVDYIPTRLSLNRFYTVGMIGHRASVLKQVRNMMISLSATHFYEDVKIVGIFDESEREFWEPLKWLPHTWDNEKQSRMLAFNKKEADQLCERIQELLEDRKRNLSDHGYKEKVSPLPHYIFLMGSKRYLQNKIMMPNLLLNRTEMGTSAIFLFDDLYNLPKECQYIVDMDGQYASAYERDKVNHKVLFTPDGEISLNQFDSFARDMSAIRVEGFALRADIPNAITFLEGCGVKTVEQLDIAKRWRNIPKKINLAAPIGMMSGGRMFALDGYDSSKNPDSHGAHGLVAGTTGSGKSELLQTWILSMAVNYPPHLVNFALIDYKGGGMSKDFKGLPHLVGEATDISAGIDRALEAFRSENEKRKIIFNRYGVNDWQEYYEKYQKGLISVTVPHLFIIVDEFAELKTERQDCMKEFISIARIGRSLGVHLLLATQTPSGVVSDEISNNSNFKICLKMQTGGESRTVIGTTDAAQIRNAGRAYVKIGEAGMYEMFQSFWCGAPYYGAGSGQGNVNKVRIVETDGTRIRVSQDNRTRIKSDIKEIHAIVRHLRDIAERMYLPKMQELWMPELEDEIMLKSVGSDRGFQCGVWGESEKWLRIPIGKYDSPATQSQGVQYIDFKEGGHLGIYGAPQTGKTSFLKTIMYSAGLHFNPEDVVIYGIDCGGGSMKIFEQMPHIGGIAKDTESDKIDKLVQMLTKELARRKEVVEQYHLTNLADYRETVKKDIPAVLLLIDNLPGMIEYYENLEEWLVHFLREASAYGMYVIFTANSSSSVKYKIQQNVKSVAAFELIDKGEYGTLVGSMKGKSLPNKPGRAYVKVADQPTLIQVALPIEGENELDRSKRLLGELEEMHRCWKGKRPDPIPVMPNVVRVKDLQEVYGEKDQIPLGISYKSMQPVRIGFEKESCLVVYGLAGKGKSRFLESMAGLLKTKDSQVYVFDSLKRSLAECENYVDQYCMVSDLDNAEDMFMEIKIELNARMKARKQASMEPGYRKEDFAKSFSQIVIMIDDWHDFISEIDEEIYEHMFNILSYGQGLGLAIFIAGRTTDFTNMYDANDAMTTMVIGMQRGIVLSGSLAMCSYLKTDVSNEDRATELNEGESWLLEQGNCVKIKPLG